MILLQSEFNKDIIILLVVTIIVISIISLIVGYTADYYFGDTISGIIGEYGEYDLALIFDGEAKDEAFEQLTSIVNNNFPGSEIILGVELVGKVNYFIKLNPTYKNKKTYMKIGEYFKNLSGLNSISIVTEPKITIRGLKRKAITILDPQINQIAGVDFSFSEGDKLEIILKKGTLIDTVQAEVDDLLQKYQVISIRFPITEQEEKIIELGDQLITELKKVNDFPIINITSTGLTDIESLVKTMTEMKKFLVSYATNIEVDINDERIKVGDRFILPSSTKEQIVIRITNIKEDKAQAVIITGDSRDILGKQAYYLKEGQLGRVLGNITVENPRQQLAYAVTETTKLLPRLDSIFEAASNIITKLVKLTNTFKVIENSVFELKSLNQELNIYQKDLKQADLNSIEVAIKKLDIILSRLVKVVEELNFIKELLEDFSVKLMQIAEGLESSRLTVLKDNPYRNDILRLEAAIIDSSTRINRNTARIINYINQYNPLLDELLRWQANVQKLNSFISGVNDVDKENLKLPLEKITDEDLIDKITTLDNQQLQKQIGDLRKNLIGLEEINLKSIIKEIEYIEKSLPKLKDEEITETMDLIDQHLAGQVIPGSEILLLIPTKNADINKLKQEIKRFFFKDITIYSLDVGAISPNLRGQLYQILGEVRSLLTAVTAIVLTFLVLIFDHSLIISSLRVKQGRSKWYLDEGNYYGVIIGALIFGISFYLARARIPYLPSYTSFLIGGLMGLIVAKKAEVFNGIAKDEFQAGQALGFKFVEIMRQIIIPAGKPGLLKLLNNKKTYF